MNTTVTVQVPTDTLLQLIAKLRRRGGSQDISEAITNAIEYWLEDPARFAPGADPEDMHGYQWKSLFLPAGTVLKSWSYGENNYARVEGYQIIHMAAWCRRTSSHNRSPVRRAMRGKTYSSVVLATRPSK
jgi:hypothetical protein